MDDKKTRSLPPAGRAPAATAGAATLAPEPAAKTLPEGPLILKRGAKIRLGFRAGLVKSVRGGGTKPYEVMVHWDGEKYPQWITFRTLELDHERGRLTLIG
ncbi:MAG TPA: hypothetical protein VMT52_07205 [Planctomycetota bacterium]|nr:hypothetical protein [Planctomycetota bacterium]